MNKPLVYNYKTAEDKIERLTERIRGLNNENSMLKKRIEGLKDSNANLRNACRIAEADRPKVAYLCDGRACGSDCGLADCERTTQIEHAKNFAKEPTGYYYEVEPRTKEDIVEIVEKLADSIRPINAVGDELAEILESVKKRLEVD